MSLRKHSLEVTHGDYRRESFHCEHSLQSLLEIEGENGPAPPSPSSSSSPSPPMGAEVGGLSQARRLGRQESPLSRDALVMSKEKGVVTTAPEHAGSQSERKVPSESKTAEVEMSKTPSSAVGLKSGPSHRETRSSPGKPPDASRSEAAVLPREKTPTGPPKSQQQDAKQQTDCRPASKAQEKTEEKDKGAGGGDKTNLQSKHRKGPEVGDKGGAGGRDKATEATKTKAPAPTAPVQVHPPSSARHRPERPAVSSRGPKEERAHLEALEENPVSPSSVSPPSNKSRPMSPGDKASFVTQLTSVAKTVLGPMKGGSQETGKTKDTTKTSEERKGGSGGKAEATSGGVRRMGHSSASGSSGAAHSEKTRSSKHHS